MMNQKMNKPQLALLLAIGVILIILAGCSSSSSNPINPTNPYKHEEPTLGALVFRPASPDLLPDIIYSSLTHSLQGMYAIDINPYTLTAAITPYREASMHFNVTSMLPAPTIIINYYDYSKHIIDIDLTITNPSTINGYDVRLIVYTDNLGHKLLNYDDWTALYDLPGGYLINPFKAYAKDQSNRIFAGQTEHTENLEIYLPGGNWNFKIAVDASYPTNCEEPYEIVDFTQGIITDEVGSSTEIEVKIHAWDEDVNAASLYCPAITGVTFLPLTQKDSETWTATLTNNTGAEWDDYFGYLIATTSKSGSLALFDEVVIEIKSSEPGGWARTWGGTGDDYGYDIAVYGDYIYASGAFASTVDFNPDPDEEEIRTASGPGDAFFTKFNKYGDFLWVRTWGGSEIDFGKGIDTDGLGNVYITGGFYGTADFGTGGTPDEHTSNGECDAFITKYTGDGDYLLTETWGGVKNDLPNAIHVDTNGNIHLTGNFLSTTDFDPDEIGEDWHSPASASDVFVSKFSQDGDFQWAGTWGGGIGNYGGGVSADETGYIYCSGYFEGSADFDPGSGEDIHTSMGDEDAFLSKFDSNGNFEWAHTWGGIDWDEASAVAVDEYKDVYVCGRFHYTVDFNPDPFETEERTAVWENDCFVSKYALDGDFKWVLVWGSENPDYCNVMATDHSGHFWVGGKTRGTIDYDPGSGIDIRIGGNFLSKFEINGNYIWSRQWESFSMIHNCDVSAEGDSYIGGWFNDLNTDFDPGDSIDFHSPIGGWDCFVVKVLKNGYWD